MPITQGAGHDRRSRAALAAPLALALVAAVPVVPAHAQSGDGAKEPAAGRGQAVTVLRAARTCFANSVQIFGVLVPRDEVPVMPPRDGLKVVDVLVDAGDQVTAGQTLATLRDPNGGATPLTAPAAGVISASTALIGMTTSLRSDPLFKIIAGGAFDMVGQATAEDMLKLKADQAATVRVAGAGDISGKVRQVAATVEPNTQLGRVTIALDASKRLLANAAASATVKMSESCGLSVPLTAVLYSDGATIVQVVRNERVETRQVTVGLMAGGQVEIRSGIKEGDVVVARSGAALREGDFVRAVTTGQASPNDSQK